MKTPENIPPEQTLPDSTTRALDRSYGRFIDSLVVAGLALTLGSQLYVNQTVGAAEQGNPIDFAPHAETIASVVVALSAIAYAKIQIGMHNKLDELVKKSL